MLFENKSKNPIQVRKGSPFNFYWITIRENERVELPEEVGLKKGLTKVEKEVLKPKINGKQAETKVFKGSEKNFKDNSKYDKELQKIKGIGPKTAEDISRVYPTQELLIKSIKEKKHMPFRNDIVRLLQKKFKKKSGVKNGR